MSTGPEIPRGHPARLQWIRSAFADDFAATRRDILCNNPDLSPDDPAIEEILDSAIDWWLENIRLARDVERWDSSL